MQSSAGMTYRIQNNTLFLSPEGRITSDNAQALLTDACALLDRYPNLSVCADCSGLKYISSAGLRMLLAFKEHTDQFELTNVSPEIFDSLQITGITGLMKVSRAYREISVEGCELINRGGHGAAYKLDEDTLVKVYDRGDTLEMIERERDYAHRAFMHGIPTAIPYDVVKCGDYYGLIFELIHADNLSKSIGKYPEKIEEYAGKYAATLKKLHTTTLESGVLAPIKPIYHEKVDAMRKYCAEDELARLHAFIDWIPDRETICHGDFHEKNMMVRDGELVLIDMAKFTTGHPIFDLSVMYTTHILSGKDHPEMTEKHLGIKYGDAVKMWKLFLRHYFGTTDETELESIQALISRFAEFQALTGRGADPNFPESMVPMLMQRLRGQLFGIMDELMRQPMPF